MKLKERKSKTFNLNLMGSFSCDFFSSARKHDDAEQED